MGSEGTLGVITEATVRLTDLPAAVLGVLAFFPDRATAIDFVEVARSAARADPHGALSPRCLEYLDAGCVDLARSRVGDVPAAAAAALFCEQEVESVGEDGHLAAWWDALTAAGALVDGTIVATDRAAQTALHAFRHAIPAGINEQAVKNGMPKVGTDLSVPDAGLNAMMDAYERAPGRTFLFGHIGDNHLHLNFLPTNADELATAKAYYADLARQAVALGGSVSGEHGIGKIKKAQLAMMVDAATLAAFRRLKLALDPAWILGRGTMIDPSATP